jgi:hypothetical protein
MSDRIERRYRLLLRLYPKAYREERGAEMLATLMEAAESGRARPAHREVAALLVNSLRVRVGAVGTRSPGQAWLSALRVAVLLLVAHAAAQSAARAGALPGQGGLALVSDLGHPAALVAGVLALVMIARGRYWAGVLLIAVEFGLAQWAMSWLPLPIRLVDGDGEFWQLPLAALLAVPLLVRRPAPTGRPLAWLLAIPLAVFLLPTEFDATLGWQPYALLAVAAGCLVWSIVDTRASIAGAALLLGPSLSLLSLKLPGWPQGLDGEYRVLLPTYLAVAAVSVCVGAVLIRRRAGA